MTTLADVAREAGCSAATVSRALSGNVRISAGTRQRVEQAAKRLNYRGSSSRWTTLQNQKTIGLVVPTIQYSYYHDDTSLLYDLLSREGYKIVLCCHNNDPLLDGEIVRSLVAHPVVGIIHRPCTPEGVEGVLKGTPKIPIIELSRVPIIDIVGRPRSRMVDVVCTDEEEAIKDIVQHLVELGHQHIAMFAGRKTAYHNKVRARFFRTAIDEANLNPTDCPAVFGPWSTQSAGEAMISMLDLPNRPTAVLFFGKPAAIGALIALEKAKVHVPDEISIVGFYNEDWYAVTNPPLTTYEHPFREMGMLAAQMLLRRLQPNYPVDSDPGVVRFAGQILLRSSTSVAPILTP